MVAMAAVPCVAALAGVIAVSGMCLVTGVGHLLGVVPTVTVVCVVHVRHVVAGVAGVVGVGVLDDVTLARVAPATFGDLTTVVVVSRLGVSGVRIAVPVAVVGVLLLWSAH
ncbi:hypothetical protein [Georgenia subflava]|uniref:hypothetical protein n=1 Tax=Georgenia subflava TaxID=1622177 RepID=UPI001D0080C0|nr:hypothetical protein [Georgenia subflava]